MGSSPQAGFRLGLSPRLWVQVPVRDTQFQEKGCFWGQALETGGFRSQSLGTVTVRTQSPYCEEGQTLMCVQFAGPAAISAKRQDQLPEVQRKNLLDDNSPPAIRLPSPDPTSLF